jgi:hypothetical protein
MKTKIIFSVALLIQAYISTAQSFKKGTLIIGISEGSTFAHYKTTDIYSQQVINDQIIKGDRDPLQIEYGLTNKLGIALSFGNDIYKINPQKFYNYNYSNLMKSKSSESVIEINYHFYTANKWDLALFLGLGSYRVELFNKDSQCLKNAMMLYDKGDISRTGIKARYYFNNRWAILGMFSFFNATAKSSKPYPNDDISHYRVQTNVSGCTLEFGLSYKIIK